MSPFKLMVEIRTPFHMRFPVTLDALLIEAKANQTGLPPEQVLAEIPLQQKNGIFQASSMRLERRETRTGVGRVQSLRGDFDQSTLRFSPNKRKKDYSPIDQARGPYKSNLDSYDAISCPWVSWSGVGDAQACRALLQDYLVGIGKRASGGAGEIGTIDIIALDHDQSWMNADGLPARPLSAEQWAAIGGSPLETTLASVAWPYYNGDRVIAVMPSLQ